MIFPGLRLAVISVGAVLAGCIAMPAPDELPMAEAAPFSPAGAFAPPQRWWMAFGDPQLDEQIARALAGNLTLVEAAERLREAGAIAGRTVALRRPSVDGVANATIREGSDVQRESEIGLGLAASYEVDLWGRIDAAIAAERLRTLATASDYQTLAISLSAEVALAWFGLAEAGLQLELIRSQLETNRTVLQVLEQRFAVGQSRSADILRQRQLVEAAREQLLVAQAAFEVLEHRLAVLEGRPPQNQSPSLPSALPPLPAMPATGLPSELLTRRPDVQATLFRLEAADADLAEAVRDQYPRIDLAAAITTAGENPAQLFSSWLASLSGQLVAPLADGGRREAEIQRRLAVRRQLLAQHGQAVLVAFREIEDALAQERLQVERIERIADQLALARDTSDQLRTQYLNQAADYIDFLTSLRDQQQLERDLLTARLDALAFRVALYRSLAGDIAAPPDFGVGFIRAEQSSEPPRVRDSG